MQDKEKDRREAGKQVTTNDLFLGIGAVFGVGSS